MVERQQFARRCDAPCRAALPETSRALPPVARHTRLSRERSLLGVTRVRPVLARSLSLSVLLIRARQRVRRWLGELLWRGGEDSAAAAMEIFRIKGVLAVAASAQPFIVQAVHEQFDITESRTAPRSERCGDGGFAGGGDCFGSPTALPCFDRHGCFDYGHVEF